MRVVGTVALDAGGPGPVVSTVAGDVAAAVFTGVRSVARTVVRDVATLVRARRPTLFRVLGAVRPAAVAAVRAVAGPRLVAAGAAPPPGGRESVAQAQPFVEVPRQHTYELALPDDPTAPGRGRALLHRAAGEWGVDEDPLHDAAMVVTELVANAVDHARTPSTLTLAFDERGLTIAVRDGNAAQGPRPRPVDPGARRGRGLQMVEALAASWGVTVHPDGKTVWAVLGPECYVGETSSAAALDETSSGTA
jgi:anti-sigma regulatory factor (Ser/Thr protein kinase)